ncbi:MAG: hypothetical protein L0322_25300, partial [Chloroflexi bacterium]|nr:hypothetical protein [Chloroflexota bacterium]
VGALVLLALAAAAYFWWQSAGAVTGQAQATLLSLPTPENAADLALAGFARAMEPDTIEFPRDLGPHNDYQTEWWYYTGNLATAGGRPFGFQLTFFRLAVASPGDEAGCAGPDSVAIPSCAATSAWRTNQIYLVHFTISDIAAEKFYASERFSRGAAGLAGAQAVPYRVWLEEWSASEVEPGVVRLVAATEEVRLDIALRQMLPPILHGDGGLSPKGPEPGNASYYYSIVQQAATGTVTVGDQQFAVTGRAWKDHEYSTSALSPGAVGWDWFSLQLDNGAALMFFQIRREDGALEPISSGTFIRPDGATEPLSREDWQLEVLDTWTSPTSGAEYPAGWRITIPRIGLMLEGQPLMSNQELNVSTVYWEGASAFSGTLAGQAVSAQGYVELTGYAEPLTGRL